MQTISKDASLSSRNWKNCDLTGFFESVSSFFTTKMEIVNNLSAENLLSGLTDCAFGTFENSELKNPDSYAPKKMCHIVTGRPKYVDHEFNAAKMAK